MSVEVLHVYPFTPWGMHGGTMRLRFAARATESAGLSTAVVCWDPSGRRWFDVAVDDIGAPDPSPATPKSTSRVGVAKRNLFPSTLWESGRHAARELPSTRHERLVLHTSYLAPLVRPLIRSGSRVSVDVYDLVWRVHQVDALQGNVPVWAVRQAYAATVRPRELSGLRAATSLLSAGWSDKLDLQRASARDVTWAPTGLDTPLVPSEESAAVRVGLIGNFDHSATVVAASKLLESPLADAEGVEIVFAGRGSDAWARATNVVPLGLVDSIEDFYRAVDATVVPVTNPSGMKTKLAEAALAGKPVLTTMEGAVGYHPSLRDHFVIVDDASELTAQRVRLAVSETSPSALRAAFREHLGMSGATTSYLAGLGLK